MENPTFCNQNSKSHKNDLGRVFHYGFACLEPQAMACAWGKNVKSRRQSFDEIGNLENPDFCNQNSKSHQNDLGRVFHPGFACLEPQAMACAWAENAILF